MIGNSPPIFRLTDSITAVEVSGWHEKTCPRFSTFGHEIFTSTALIPDTARNRLAKTPYSSTVSPAIETTIFALFSISQGMSFSKKVSIPGPCNPMEFNIPLGVSAILGVALPVLAFVIIDFVTTAPSSVNGKNCDNSWPELAHPLAVKIGLEKRLLPILVEKSRALIYNLSKTVFRSQIISDPSITGPSIQVLTIFIPSLNLTGTTQVMQTPIPHAIASSTAHW